MRPYWAIIKDSFRAALASRVLYVLLGLITILLIALAPFHYKEVMDWKIQFGRHVSNPTGLMTRLVEGKDDPEKLGAIRIWEMLPTKLKNDLQEIVDEQDPEAGLSKPPPGGGQRFAKAQQLIEELNEIIQDPTFYREADWKGRPLKTEAEDLIKADPSTLSEERSRRLNRLLVGSALSPMIQAGADTSLNFYYATFKWDFLSTNTTRAQFSAQVASVIPYLFDKTVLPFGLLIAILVTANIIPETFDPGSLNLLLSKPVSRWGLFLAKFFGGCAFVALCACYLFLGIWLWLGFGLGVWDRAFLLSIPLYVLVFAIYYSVSALVGLSYRNAIMAIIVTGLFWAFCWSVGLGYYRLNAYQQNMQLMDVSPAGDQLFAVNGLGQTMAWNQADNAWDKQESSGMSQDEEVAMGIVMFMGKLREEPTRMPPILDENSQAIIMGGASLIDPLARNRQNCLVSPKDKADFTDVGKMPSDSVAMFAGKEGPIFVNSSGRFFRLESADLKDLLAGRVVKSSKDKDEKEAAESNVLTTETDESKLSKKKSPKVAKAKSDKLFKSIGPDHPIAARSVRVAFNRQTEEIAIYNRAKLYIFKPENGSYIQHRSVEIDTKSTPTMSCLVEFAGDTVLLVLGNGQVITVDSATMKEKKGYRPEKRSGIDEVVASQDGRFFGLRYQNNKAWILDTQNDERLRRCSVGGQGDISSIGFDDQNQFWVIDRNDRASKYDPVSMTRSEVNAPKSGWLDLAYRYGLEPFYNICPKPGEFYKVVTHLSESADTTSNTDVDLVRRGTVENPWSPLTSGLAFMGTMLLISCLIFHFKDY